MIEFRACFIFLCIIFVLTGCSGVSPDTTDRITRPENRAVTLQGTWKVEEGFARGTGQTAAAGSTGKWMGTTVGFTGDEIVFGDYSWSNVNYKIKRVNADEYFLHKYSDAIDRFGIKDKEILVITASSDDRFLYEFVKVNNDRIIVNIDDEYFSMKKISPEFKGITNGAAKDLNGAASVIKENNVQMLRSGLLLGVRIPVKTDAGNTSEKPDEYIYRTYWIACMNGLTRPAFTSDGLFLPRKDGFWHLVVMKKLGSEGIEDYISASMVPGNDAAKQSPGRDAKALSKRVETKLKKTILYVGNDYICVENAVYGNLPDTAKTVVKKVLRTLPIDNLSNTEGIKISDLVGDNGSIAVNGAITDLLGASGINDIKNTDEVNQDENFALYRKTGHWFFKGRLNFAENEQLSFMDFSINLIPPPDIVAYDMLHIPWTAIKDRIPQAVDAYTSPNSDIAVVLTRNAVMIFSLGGGILSENPVEKLKLPDGASVVMAEWATGDYVLNWEKAFIKNNTVNEAGKE